MDTFFSNPNLFLMLWVNGVLLAVALLTRGGWLVTVPLLTAAIVWPMAPHFLTMQRVATAQRERLEFAEACEKRAYDKFLEKSANDSIIGVHVVDGAGLPQPYDSLSLPGHLIGQWPSFREVHVVGGGPDIFGGRAGAPDNADTYRVRNQRTTGYGEKPVPMDEKIARHVIEIKPVNAGDGSSRSFREIKVGIVDRTTGKTIAERVDYLLNQPPIQFAGVTYYGGALRTCQVSHLTNFVKLAVSPLSAAMAQ